MFKSLSIAGLVGYAHAQSAQFTDYAATTAALTSTSDGSIATTSMAYELQEAIMGAQSTTLFI